MPRRLTLALLFLVLRAACAAEPAQAEGAFPVLPKGYQLNVGDTGDLVFVELDDHAGKSRTADAIYTYWNTSTGARNKLGMPTDFYADKVAPAGQGLVLVGTKAAWPATDHEQGLIAFTGANDKPVVGALPVSRHIPRLVVLADQSALVFGGWITATGPKLKTVERAVLKDGRVEVERMPDLPGAGTGYAVVALKDGRAMLVGGSDQKYDGTCPCQAETWLLDPKARRWSKGPRLIEPRSDASVTVLPNGDVLVAGGWTPGHGWQEGASRTTERWKPGSANFVADGPLPAGVAMHQAMWAAGRQGKDLLILGGMARAWQGSSAVMDFDTATGIWRTVGEGCSADKPDKLVKAATAVAGGLAYMWCSVELMEPPLRFALRLPSSGPIRIPQPDGIALRRSDMAFLPAKGDGPALAVGGKANEAATGDVDAIWPDGRIEALPPLRTARAGGAVFALADGTRIVVGGTDSKGAELLPAGAAAAKQPGRVLALELSSEDVVGQSADGRLLALRADGRVESIALQAKANGGPVLQHTQLAPVGRSHHSGQSGKAVIKGIGDGRIIVAGGEEQPYTIALLQEDSMGPEAPDRYVGAGEFEPARRYQIYDPALRAWRESVPARTGGGTVAVLDDGRVLKLAPGGIEASTASGDAWRPFESKQGQLVKLDGEARLFALQGEIFLSGAGPGMPSGEGPGMLQWFDSAKREWVTQWQADPKNNWRENVGRILARTLANGKRVVIPVEGL
ncbi:MAG: hypothetical protein ACXWC4_10830 [Telluria sp.]